MSRAYQRRWLFTVVLGLSTLALAPPAQAYEASTHSLFTHLSWEYLHHRANERKDQRAQIAEVNLSRELSQLRLEASNADKLVLGLKPTVDLFISPSPTTTDELLWSSRTTPLISAGVESLLAVTTAQTQLTPTLWVEAQVPWIKTFESELMLDDPRGSLLQLSQMMSIFAQDLSSRLDESLCQSSPDAGWTCQAFKALSSGKFVITQQLSAPLSAFWIAGAIISHSSQWLAPHTPQSHFADDFWGCYSDQYYRDRDISPIECQATADKLSSVHRWLIPAQPIDEHAIAKARLVSAILACRAQDADDPSFDLEQECDPGRYFSHVAPWYLQVTHERSLLRPSVSFTTRLPLWQDNQPWMAQGAELSSLSEWIQQRPALQVSQLHEVEPLAGSRSEPRISHETWLTRTQATWSDDAVAGLLFGRVCQDGLATLASTQDGLGNSDCSLSSFEQLGSLAATTTLPLADETVWSGWTTWTALTRSSALELSTPARTLSSTDAIWNIAHQIECSADGSTWPKTCSSPSDCALQSNCEVSIPSRESASLSIKVAGLGKALHALQELGIPSRLTSFESDIDERFEHWSAAYLDPSSQTAVSILDGEAQGAKLCRCAAANAACQSAPCSGRDGIKPATSLKRIDSPWGAHINLEGQPEQSGYLRLKQELRRPAKDCEPESWQEGCLWPQVDQAFEQLLADMEVLGQSHGSCPDAFSSRRLTLSLGFRLLQALLDESAQDQTLIGSTPQQRLNESFWQASLLAGAAPKAVIWSVIKLQQPELIQSIIGTDIWRRFIHRSTPYIIAAGTILLREAGDLTLSPTCDDAPKKPLQDIKVDANAAFCSSERQALLRWCFDLEEASGNAPEDCRQFENIDAYTRCNSLDSARSADDCGLVANAIASCVCAFQAGQSTSRLDLTVSQKERLDDCIVGNLKHAQASLWQHHGSIDALTARHLTGASVRADADKDGIPDIVDQCPKEPSSGWRYRAPYIGLADGVCLKDQAESGQCAGYGCAYHAVGEQ